MIRILTARYGTLCIRENPGCLFIATNRDAVGHMTDLQEWPGAGCMVAAMCGSTEREPIVVGKPSTFIMEFLLKKFQIDTSRMCMVGDRLDTDILFGQNAGCRTLPCSFRCDNSVYSGKPCKQHPTRLLYKSGF
ncbi:hypothetical protein Patl1_09654 [Pistacia atlantica]|uniref:Uncharacterized protein n=1 Tax=Pistacia atlantica TaxID=434234 RepID=A0ACC1A5I3_9ROSI|nr:hypothetical protein Patl1_09654 [Pistacia atlantica]